MAQLLSIATGNASAAGTWGLVDATSFVSSTETAVVLTTSRVGVTTFTPGAITVAGIAVKLAVRTGTTGTITVDLDQGGSLVAGTDVTINVSDLPVAATADLNGGWHYFQFASPVTLLAATAYAVKCKTSSSSQVSLFATSGSNWSRCLVTTTTQAPAAGDNMIVCGKYTGAGASTSYTVTWDITATTDFGSTPTASNSLLAPGICVCNKGTLSVGTTAATNYNMKMSNSIIVYTGGTLNFGTTGTPMPRDSTFTLQFDCGANVDYGLTIRNLGTFNAQGLSRTSGKNIYYCLLNTDEAVNQTTLGVDTDTGWLDNDVIAVASTTRTYSQTESGSLNGNAGASSLTVDGFAGVAGGLAFAHSGTSPTQAEVILLTRNVEIKGASAALQAYVVFAATATVDCDWTAFKWMGSATANKRGIQINTTTGSCSIEYCSCTLFSVASSRMFDIASTSGSNININYNVTFSSAQENFINVATTGTQVVTYNVFTSSATTVVTLGDSGTTFTNNRIAGGNSNLVAIAEPSGTIGTFSNNIAHSAGSTGIIISGVTLGGTILDCTVWRATSGSIYFSVITNSVSIKNCTLFGGGYGVFCAITTSNLVLDNVNSAGDSSFNSAAGLYIGQAASFCEVTIINSDFGTATGIKIAHSSSDIGFVTNGGGRIKIINTKLATTPEVSGNSVMTPSSIVSSQRTDTTAGSHKTWKLYGVITIETTTTHTGGTSIKMTPNSASGKLESSGFNGGFKVGIASGQTCTPTVYVYEDGSYNGNRARLIVKRNDALGITADTVLDTATAASDAAWEALTGTTAAVTDSGTLEFIIDCDGTAGNLFVDTFSATVA